MLQLVETERKAADIEAELVPGAVNLADGRDLRMVEDEPHGQRVVSIDQIWSREPTKKMNAVFNAIITRHSVESRPHWAVTSYPEFKIIR